MMAMSKWPKRALARVRNLIPSSLSIVERHAPMFYESEVLHLRGHERTTYALVRRVNWTGAEYEVELGLGRVAGFAVVWTLPEIEVARSWRRI